MRRWRPWLAAAGAIGLLAAPGAAREVRITVLHTADLHGHLSRPRPDEPGGLLALGALIERIRAEDPQALLVDCGDTIQGSPEAFATRGRAVIEAMGILRYDAWTLGNHDFDWGVEALRPLVRDAPFAVLAANVRERFGEPHPVPGVQPFVLRTVDGVRVAIVGLTTPGIPSWTLPDALEGTLVEASVPALERCLPALRAGRADVRILAAHQGLPFGGDDRANEIRRIAREFPEFDLILGGHTHQAVEGERVGGVLFSQAGSHGRMLGRVTLIYDTVQRRVVRGTAELIPVEAGAPAHPELEARLGRTLARVERNLARRIGTASEPLPARSDGPGGGEVGRLLRDAIRTALDADIVLQGALTPDGLDAGPITERDLWTLVPYENRLGLALFTFGELREILEENLERGEHRILGLSGALAEFHPDAPAGARILSLTLPDGTAPHPRRRFRVAVGSYALASGGGRFPELRRLSERPEARLTITPFLLRDAVREYLRTHSPVPRPAGPAEGYRPAAAPGRAAATVPGCSSR